MRYIGRLSAYMEKLVITGGRRLNGEVFISGAKNAAVAIIPAAIMADGVCVIDNLPDIEDVASLRSTLNKMGAVCEYIDKHTLKVDSTGDITNCAAFEEVKKIRASYYLLGALLGRYKKAEVALPGGCNFGTRPIDLHLKGFRLLGADVEVTNGIVKVKAERLHGAQIYMDQVSVGATINIMLAASMAEGTTIIENCAKEPHVVDTANFLNMMGANIKGAGTDIIRIKGVEKLHGAEYTIIPDQIEAGTYMIAAAIAGDRKINTVRIGIRIAYGNDGNAQTARFMQSQTFFNCINDENQIGTTTHIFYTAQRTVQFFTFTGNVQLFFFCQTFEFAFFLFGIDFFQTTDGLRNRFPVCQCSTQPTVIDIILTATFSSFFNRLLSLCFCSDEQHTSALSGCITNGLHCTVQHGNRLL